MSFSSFKNPATYHLLSYGTLLGSTLFQSFVSGIVAFRVLPRPQFSTLQKHTFPVYFTLQTLTPVVMLLTYPRGGAPSLLPFLSSSPMPPTATDNLSSWLHTTMFLTALVNWVYIGPKTTEVMGLRKHQETRDGKKSYDAGPHSKEMQALNKQFGILHGVSSLVNMVGLGAMIWYGAVLAEGLNVANKLAHPLKTWETQERSIARDKARVEAKMLDIPWTKFIRDVESATLEVHVLTPTRYEAPCGDRIKNQEASTRNEGVLYKFGALKDMDEDKEWKKKDAAIYNVLKAFQGGRCRD
ncbi:hypothetical protein AALT_g2938 [Alternaria alternata]|nr:hypothetical protein AALT_g2938 [Alternaria alternata]